MVIFHKKWKKYNEIQLPKNKMDLNIRKITNHPSSQFPLFKGLAVADDMTELVKKMFDTINGQGLDDYSSVCISNHFDYEKWNNHQRIESNGPVFLVMEEFLGHPKLIYRTHEFFEKSLIYYNDRPDLTRVRNNRIENTLNNFVSWEGQDGGFDGLRQKGLSILNYLVIKGNRR